MKTIFLAIVIWSCSLPTLAEENPILSAKPADATYACAEHFYCKPNQKVVEVWYGFGNRWIKKYMTGEINCSNEFFGKDPFPSIEKKCFERKAPGSLPSLSLLHFALNLHNILTADNGRYTMTAHKHGSDFPLTVETSLTLDALGPPSLTDNDAPDVFKFDITDSVQPIRNYSVMIALTKKRCLRNSKEFSYITPSENTIEPGRLIEIYSIISSPSEKVYPLRTIPLQLCTADSGDMAVTLLAPEADDLQLQFYAFNFAEEVKVFLPVASNWWPIDLSR